MDHPLPALLEPVACILRSAVKDHIKEPLLDIATPSSCINACHVSLLGSNTASVLLSMGKCYCTPLDSSHPSGPQDCINYGPCRPLDECTETCIDGRPCGNPNGTLLSAYSVPGPLMATLSRRDGVASTTAASVYYDVTKSDSNPMGFGVMALIIVGVAIGVAACVGWHIWRKKRRDRQRHDAGRSPSAWRVLSWRGYTSEAEWKEQVNLDASGFVISHSLSDTPDALRGKTSIPIQP